MLSLWLVLSAAAVLALSGLPACWLSSQSVTGQRATTLLVLVGSVLGLGGLVLSLGQTTPSSLHVAWLLPWGQFAVAIAAYFAATVEEDNAEVRQAGWVYLVAARVAARRSCQRPATCRR